MTNVCMSWRAALTNDAGKNFRQQVAKKQLSLSWRQTPKHRVVRSKYIKHDYMDKRVMCIKADALETVILFDSGRLVIMSERDEFEKEINLPFRADKVHMELELTKYYILIRVEEDTCLISSNEYMDYSPRLITIQRLLLPTQRYQLPQPLYLPTNLPHHKVYLRDIVDDHTLHRLCYNETTREFSYLWADLTQNDQPTVETSFAFILEELPEEFTYGQLFLQFADFRKGKMARFCGDGMLEIVETAKPSEKKQIQALPPPRPDFHYESPIVRFVSSNMVAIEVGVITKYPREKGICRKKVVVVDITGKLPVWSPKSRKDDEQWEIFLNVENQLLGEESGCFFLASERVLRVCGERTVKYDFRLHAVEAPSMKPITFFGGCNVPNMLTVIDRDLVVVHTDLGYFVIDISDPRDLRSGSRELSNQAWKDFFNGFSYHNLAIVSKDIYTYYCQGQELLIREKVCQKQKKEKVRPAITSYDDTPTNVISELKKLFK